MNEDAALRAEIIAKFGPEAYNAGTGLLNRPWMAAQVFSDPAGQSDAQDGGLRCAGGFGWQRVIFCRRLP
jgi:hypothetical protein